MNIHSTFRPEHPRPDFQRDTFENLNGVWQFAFDDGNEGLSSRWYMPGHSFDRQIVVPFAYQTKLSGIGPTDEIHPILWYRRSFVVPASMVGKRVLLRFGAVDFEARVYVNGELAGTHRGGYTPFCLDITNFLRPAPGQAVLGTRPDGLLVHTSQRHLADGVPGSCRRNRTDPRPHYPGL